MNHYSIFIDESCHLERDGSDIMTIGYIKIPDSDILEVKRAFNRIKSTYNIPYELKWNKIGSHSFSFYKEIIDLFFNSSMQFRCVLVKYKSQLNHQLYNDGEHDIFYYKIIYNLLINPFINDSHDAFRVFLDIKDTKGRLKLRKIEEVMKNKFHGSSPFKSFQHIRSNESVFIQLVDILIGAVTYKSKGLEKQKESSLCKKQIIEYLEERSGYFLNEGTEPSESKFNIFDHQPRRRNEI